MMCDTTSFLWLYRTSPHLNVRYSDKFSAVSYIWVTNCNIQPSFLLCIDKKTKKERAGECLLSQVGLNYLASAALACSAIAVKAAASLTAKSANILRFISFPETFIPWISLL